MVEFGCKLDEKMKDMLEKQRKMYREPIVMGRKLELKSTVWTRRKKETSNQKRMKEQEVKKLRRGLGTSRTTLNVPTSESYGCQKEMRKRKKWKTYLNK